MAIRAADHVNQVIYRAQGDIDPVLWAHESQPAAQERFPVLQLRPRRPPEGAVQPGPVSHHGHRARRHAAAQACRLLQRGVDGDHLVRGAVAPSLEPAQRPVHGPVTPSVAQCVQLRREVALVQHERPPQQPERCGEREIDVGGATDLNSVEPVGEKHPGCQPARHGERVPVFPEEPQLVLPIGGRPVGAQANPREPAVAGVTAADHGDPVAVRVQRQRLFLQPVIAGEGHVLHHEQDMGHASCPPAR